MIKELIQPKSWGFRLKWSCLGVLITMTLFSCGTEAEKKSPDTTSPPKVETPAPESEKPEAPASTETTNEGETTAVVAAGQNPVLCGGNALAAKMKVFAAEHTGVPYLKSDRTTQCSGIFQRVLGSIRRDCPDAVDKTPPANQMSSRGQGKWYFDKKALTLIKDPLAQAELIRPGVVMFYGKKSQEYYNSHPVEMLWNDTLGIRHVGVVVDVERNETGEIQSYSLFHGRYTGTPSGISNADNYMHRRVAKSDAPSFGNGSDPWVGVAAIVLQE